MTSALPNTREATNARLSESFWDNPPCGTQSVTSNSHELSTYSGHPISQQEMQAASLPRAMLPRNRGLVLDDLVGKMQMETWEKYRVKYQLGLVVEGFLVSLNGENIQIHGGEEFWGYTTSNGLMGRELDSASMNWDIVSRGHESGDMSDPDPKPQPQPQPPRGDPWGFGCSRYQEVIFTMAISHSTEDAPSA